MRHRGEVVSFGAFTTSDTHDQIRFDAAAELPRLTPAWSTMLPLVETAISELCARCEQAGYNPSCVIDLGVLVARADGVVDEKERAALRDMFETLLEERLSPAVVGHLIGASLEVIDAAGVEARVRLLAEILKDCDAVEQGLVLALVIAFASEGLSSAERAVIEQIARAGKFPMDRVESLVARVKSHMEDGGAEALSGPVSRRKLERTTP